MGRPGGEADLRGRVFGRVASLPRRAAGRAPPSRTSRKEKPRRRKRCTASTPGRERKALLLARNLHREVVRSCRLPRRPIAGSPRHSWDAHEKREGGPRRGSRADRSAGRGVVAKDIKKRGMLDDTLVLFTTEFGGTLRAIRGRHGRPGRDQNKYALSCGCGAG